MLVSVYIATKNRRAMLERAIKSVLRQTHTDIEVIVVDDGSTDGTREYLRQLAQSDQRVLLIRNERSIGACASRNAALKAAHGTFITGLDDDDYFADDRISSFVKSWTYERRVVGLYSNANRLLPGGRTKRVEYSPQLSRRDLLVRNGAGNQIFTLTSSLSAIGGFDERFPAWQDLDCWYRILHEQGTLLRRVARASYTVDASHDSGRISAGSTEAIETAYATFCSTHRLSSRDCQVLRGQLLQYSPQYVTIKVIAKHLAKSHSVESTYYLARSFAAHRLKLLRR